MPASSLVVSLGSSATRKKHWGKWRHI